MQWTAQVMVPRPRSPPSSPAPSAHRDAASGLDRDATVEGWGMDAVDAAVCLSRIRDDATCGAERAVMRRSAWSQLRSPVQGVLPSPRPACSGAAVAIHHSALAALHRCTPDDRWLVGKDSNHVGASLHFLVQSLQRVCAVQLGPVLLGEVQMRQNLPLVFGAVG